MHLILILYSSRCSSTPVVLTVSFMQFIGISAETEKIWQKFGNISTPNVSSTSHSEHEMVEMLRSASASFAAVSNNVKEFYLSIPLLNDGTEPLIKIQYDNLWLATSGFSFKLNSVSTRCPSRLVSRFESIYSFLTRIIKEMQDTARATSLTDYEKFDKLEKALKEAIFEIAKIITK